MKKNNEKPKKVALLMFWHTEQFVMQ